MIIKKIERRIKSLEQDAKQYDNSLFHHDDEILFLTLLMADIKRVIG